VRQNDPKFGELARLRIDLDRPAMLLDDDVVTNGQAKSSPFISRLCRKKRIEQLLLHFGGIPVPLSRILSSILSPLAADFRQRGRLLQKKEAPVFWSGLFFYSLVRNQISATRAIIMPTIITVPKSPLCGDSEKPTSQRDAW
jgi:hypothetical protein